MKKNLRHILALLIVVLCGLFGWWVARGWESTEVRHRAPRKSK